jgi:hypothetical protein
MQFCWAGKDKMLVKLTMDMPKHIRDRFVPQIILACPTRRARHIWSLNASERVENQKVSCTFHPDQRPNLLSQNGWN